MFSDPGSKIGKATEDVSVSGDEFALLASMSASCTKAVDLQLENKLVGIERLNAAGKLYPSHPAVMFCERVVRLN